MNAWLVSLDQGGFDQPFPASTIQLKDSVLTVTFAQLGATYRAKLGADDKRLIGTWTQTRATPLDFERATSGTAWRDSSPHNARFITVDRNVKLEVLDWGGTGLPVVLLSGLGNTAHVFDQFAAKLSGDYHVYGVTRRGFGFSSTPASGYAADRLADDVIAVLDTLGLDRPVLIGHSIAGQELSSIGSRHPGRVAGLVYLDAAFGYAYYDSTLGYLPVELADVRRKLDRLTEIRASAISSDSIQNVIAMVRSLVTTELPVLERNLREYQRTLESTQAPRTVPPAPAYLPAVNAIWAGVQKYTSISATALAIYALPRRLPAGELTDSARAAAAAADSVRTLQANAFEKGVPSARVVRVAGATHFLFLSNEADVLREIHTFIRSLRRDSRQDHR
ncbi:MAG: alpha/beta hydrolase [Gemmatimonadota bacterium]